MLVNRRRASRRLSLRCRPKLQMKPTEDSRQVAGKPMLSVATPTKSSKWSQEQTWDATRDSAAKQKSIVVTPPKTPNQTERRQGAVWHNAGKPTPNVTTPIVAMETKTINQPRGDTGCHTTRCWQNDAERRDAYSRVADWKIPNKARRGLGTPNEQMLANRR
jgi:hypothetical protein